MKFKVGDEVLKIKGAYKNFIGVVTSVTYNGKSIKWRLKSGVFITYDGEIWWNSAYFRKVTKLDKILK